MPWPQLRRSVSAHPALSREDMLGQIAAIHRSQAVIEFDLDGHILYANDNFLATTGYRLDEILGQHHRIFVPEALHDSREYLAFWEHLREGNYDSGRYRRLDKFGNEIWLQASYNPIFDHKGRPQKVVKYASDITQQVMREAEAEGLIAAISKVQAIIEFELDGTIIGANQNFLHALGYREEEIVGKHHSIFVSPHERTSADYQNFWKRLREGTHDSGQYLRIGKNDKHVWIEASYNPILNAAGEPIKVVKFATDITRRFTAAESLREAVGELDENARRAALANSLANEASSVAGKGGETVQNVVRTMEMISESSHKIFDIIGVMDTVAFQTNLLALNAAVEAARAGTAGRGFAVVAAEVRQLAQNSAAAAKEIKQLINRSVDQINEGSGLAHSAGTTMNDIVSSSHRVTEIMAELVKVSAQQSLTLGEVTRDITRRSSEHSESI